MPAPQKSILPATWEVPAEFRSRLGEKAGRQRAMMAEGHLLLVREHKPIWQGVRNWAKTQGFERFYEVRIERQGFH